MHCPFCGHDDTQVKDSRPSEDGNAIRRRRECAACEARFTTFERIQLRDLVVVKSDGRKEVFERDKLIRSLSLPLRKRPVEDEQIERIATSIIRQLESSGENEVTSEDIGRHVIQALSETDLVAFVRYASVYEDFQDLSDFNKLLDKLKKKNKKKKAA